MKRIILALITALTICSLIEAKGRTVTETDSLGNKKRVIELRDTTINGKAMIDTLSITTYDNNAGTDNRSNSDSSDWKHQKNDFDLGFDLTDGDTSETIIAVTAIIFVFGLPLLIVMTVFFFNYKNRKAKYRLAEQALASGQQLPENFFQKVDKVDDIRTKGIKNIFVGIGLFIFLWAMTNFGIGCIGLLIMFTGFGQVVIYYTQESGKSHKTTGHGHKNNQEASNNISKEETDYQEDNDKQNKTEG
ncbi:MAG: DUF6249 domain-containing protein [Bacteroides sp.]|jgi:hypothetical protein|nr:DUF6249 domain-containing protein [Bacteroides sp.]MCI1681837.1 DUF6249 domain-containing protein [Bacteroides sp.]